MNENVLDTEKTKSTKDAEKPSSPPPKARPVFFNDNVFGDDYEIEEEEAIEEEPPPPVFSEEELDAAKKAAFDKGKAEGIRESIESREQFTAALLSDIVQSAHTLIAAEETREKRFEYESVHLSLKIFEQLFPQYYEAQGFEEMRAALLTILQGEEGVSQILIEVNPDYVPDIEAFIQDCAGQLPRECCYEVSGTATFTASQFKLSWKDGGAIHNIDSIAAQIRDILNDVLAQEASNHHDNTQAPEAESAVTQSTPPTPPDDAPIEPIKTPTEQPDNNKDGDI